MEPPNNDKPATLNEPLSDIEYVVPEKGVKTLASMDTWERSQAYQEYLGFILSMNEAIKGKSCQGAYTKSEAVEGVLKILDIISIWIDEIKPMEQPQRFGNKAFRSWYDKLKQGAMSLFTSNLDKKHHTALSEIQYYFIEAFGNSTRIDYGTGHEMSFCMFLCCMCKIGAFLESDKYAIPLNVFTSYLNLVRKLQTTYKMEPAGSRGVWALDDFQFIPFIWGSSQLIGHPNLEPSQFLNEDIVNRYAADYMFLGCIKYIMETKVGPFAEHSNQLYNISGVHLWDKVNSGLIKMYKAEVLAKFPVIQHVLFGSILPITPAKKQCRTSFLSSKNLPPPV